MYFFLSYAKLGDVNFDNVT